METKVNNRYRDGKDFDARIGLTKNYRRNKRENGIVVMYDALIAVEEAETLSSNETSTASELEVRSSLLDRSKRRSLHR